MNTYQFLDDLFGIVAFILFITLLIYAIVLISL